MNSHATLADAYRSTLIDVLERGNSVPSVQDPSSPASGFGTADRPSIELIGYSFEVQNPLACIVDSDARPLRLAYCVGSLLWTLNGSNDLAHLQGYHPDARNFSDDGISLSGAFGKRLFRSAGKIDQIAAIAERLLADPASRRTFAAICNAEDNVRQTREYPCCIGVQYFLRGGRLHSLTHMRAQHALLVLPYDAFLFMAIQCLMAARIGADIGTYRHTCGTCHLYESERHIARRVIDEPLRSVDFGRPDGSKNELDDVLNFEGSVRSLSQKQQTQGLLAMQHSADSGSEFARLSKLIVLGHWVHSIDSKLTNPAIERLPDPMPAMMQRQWQAPRTAHRVLTPKMAVTA